MRFGTERRKWTVRELYALGDGWRDGLWHVWHNLPAVLVAELLWEELQAVTVCRVFGHRDTQAQVVHWDGSPDTYRAVCLRCKRYETADA